MSSVKEKRPPIPIQVAFEELEKAVSERELKRNGKLKKQMLRIRKMVACLVFDLTKVPSLKLAGSC